MSGCGLGFWLIPLTRVALLCFSSFQPVHRPEAYATPEIVQRERDGLAKLEEELVVIEAALKALG